jgi:hypothetical protein
VQGVALAPRVLHAGIDGREVLTCPPGGAAHRPLPAPMRSEKAVHSAVRVVQALHDAAQGFVAPEPGEWAPHDVGAHIRQRVDARDPVFAGQGDRDEPAGYGSAAAFILAGRDRLPT